MGGRAAAPSPLCEARDPMPDTLIDLIRHGQPEGGRRIRGNGCDDPLSPLGWDRWQIILL
jgi:hypothetical protein